ncbi:tetratricopeptide repeat protein [Parvibaculum sp.]|uniref:tetratricopeptide repeat protein n=1 Tax=Parvibaculum sp. TaxID=2024848 RepID=UPI00320D2E38
MAVRGDLELTSKFSRGLELSRQGQLKEANVLLFDVLRATPNNPGALYLLGSNLVKMRMFEPACRVLTDATRLSPGNPDAHLDLSFALNALGRPADALVCCDTALRIAPQNPAAHMQRAMLLLSQLRHEEAVRAFDQVVALAPQFADAHYNRAKALTTLNRIEEAVESYDKAIAAKPPYINAQAGKGTCLLSLGRFEEGLPLYELRPSLRKLTAARVYKQPRLTGDADISGKTLFIYHEHLLGDTIQFCRYVRLAEARGARVILSIQNCLHRFIRTLSPTIELFDEGQAPAQFDYHSPLMSLPLVWRTTASTIPAEVPYLRAEPERVAKWRRRIGDHGFKIGVSWCGSPIAIEEHRVFPIAALAKVSAMPGVRLISLQKNEGIEQLRNLPKGMRVETLGDDFDSGPDAFIDTAAVAEHLDLIITLDSSLAHVGGALARPTWVVLKHSPDWRWRMKGGDCSWYPTLRLFRQAHLGDWTSAISAVEQALTRLDVSAHQFADKGG